MVLYLSHTDHTYNYTSSSTAYLYHTTTTMTTIITPEYRRIGGGCCGSVWAQGESDRVIKWEDGADRGRSVTNDQFMHRKIISASLLDKDTPPLMVHIPQSHDLIQANNDFWKAEMLMTLNLFWRLHGVTGRKVCV